jgi:hypothetical protein
MTAPLPFTQAGIRRAVAAAQKAGLRVTAIRPDGTILVHDGNSAPHPLAETPDADSKWRDRKE